MTSVPRADVEWLVRAMAKHHGIPVEETVRAVEEMTGFSRDYMVPYRRGVMAVWEKDAKTYRIKAKDWRDNVAGGCRILGIYTKALGSYERALAAYRMGPRELSLGVVEELVEKFGDKWLLKIPSEVREFIGKVMNGKTVTEVRAC